MSVLHNHCLHFGVEREASRVARGAFIDVLDGFPAGHISLELVGLANVKSLTIRLKPKSLHRGGQEGLHKSLSLVGTYWRCLAMSMGHHVDSEQT